MNKEIEADDKKLALLSYMIQAYSENIMDAVYLFEETTTLNIFEKTKKACINFKNRLASKNNSRPEVLLRAVYEDVEEDKKFNDYRITLDKTLKFCLNTHPYDIKRLAMVVDCLEDGMLLINKKKINSMMMDARLTSNSLSDIFDKHITK